MNSVYDFIVTPVGGRYNNDIKVGDKSLVLNTSIEKFKFINKVAKGRIYTFSLFYTYKGRR